MENSTMLNDLSNIEMVIRPMIRKFKWIPEEAIEPFDDVLFDFEIVNENESCNVQIMMVRIDLKPKSGRAGKSPFPGTVTTLAGYNPPDSPVRIAFSVNGTVNAGDTFLPIPKASAAKVYGNLKTFGLESIAYPFPFSMEITFDWQASLAFNDHGSTVVEKTIEPVMQVRPPAAPAVIAINRQQKKE